MSDFSLFTLVLYSWGNLWKTRRNRRQGTHNSSLRSQSILSVIQLLIRILIGRNYIQRLENFSFLLHYSYHCCWFRGATLCSHNKAALSSIIFLTFILRDRLLDDMSYLWKATFVLTHRRIDFVHWCEVILLQYLLLNLDICVRMLVQLHVVGLETPLAAVFTVLHWLLVIRRVDTLLIRWLKGLLLPHFQTLSHKLHTIFIDFQVRIVDLSSWIFIITRDHIRILLILILNVNNFFWFNSWNLWNYYVFELL